MALLLVANLSCSFLRGSNYQATWTTQEIIYFHQGFSAGPTMMTDSGGNIFSERRYEPFGVDIDSYAGPAGGIGPSSSGVDFRREPTNILNKQSDPDTSWSYHGARWVSPQTAPIVKAPDGKFMAEPWALHPYQYVDQNPVIFWDPDGRDGAYIAGKIVQSLENHYVGNNSSSLTVSQIASLRYIYGDSITYSKIELYSQNTLLGSSADGAFVVGYNVYLQGDTSTKLLIHEIGHVWQYRHLGSGYASAALRAQDSIGRSASKNSAYNWGMLVHFNVPFSKWNPEAFAEFAEDIYSSNLSVAGANGLAVAKPGAKFTAYIPTDMTAYRQEKMNRKIFGGIFDGAAHLLYSGGFDQVKLSGKDFEGST